MTVLGHSARKALLHRGFTSRIDDEGRIVAARAGGHGYAT